MNNQSGGRPQLKKIKRPINRTVPQTSAQKNNNTNPFNSGRSMNQAPAQQQQQRPPFDDVIDTYLDETPVSGKSSTGNNMSSGQLSPQTKYPEQSRYLREDEYEDEVYGRAAIAVTPEWLSTKVLVLIAVVCLFIGIVLGKLMFAESKVVRNGLQGVVVNNEVPRGRARCGVAERSQGCVLYIMNPQRQDMRAKDFYDLAAQMTGRQRFMIETGNMRYANSKIKPGDIAQLNIPPL